MKLIRKILNELNDDPQTFAIVIIITYASVLYIMGMVM